jgi:hypothetical protein
MLAALSSPSAPLAQEWRSTGTTIASRAAEEVNDEAEGILRSHPC